MMEVNDFRYLIIGGSTKCATTSLFEYLAVHPQINASVKKESRFFWTDEYKISEETVNYKNGIEHYNEVFTTSKKTDLRLEATPDYLYSQKTMQLFADNVHQCKFIFVLRNPVDRIISWYKFSKQLNLIPAKEPIDVYISKQLKANQAIQLQHERAVEQGRYGYYLKPWYEKFSSQNIYVCFYNDLTENPLNEMQSICRFAGIDETFYKNFEFKVYNKSVVVKDAEQFSKYRVFRRNLRRTLKSVPLGKLIKQLLKPVDTAYMNKQTTAQAETISISDDLLNRLKNLYEADKKQLEILIQKKVNW